MSARGPFVEFEGVVAVGETAQGVWVRLADQDKDVFVPQSQIGDDSEVYQKGDEGTLVVTEWWANERGLT